MRISDWSSDVCSSDLVTHQGATWVDPSPPLGRLYGTQADAARLAADVEKIRRYIARTGRKPFIGETGAYEALPLAGRVQYHRAVHDAFAPLDLGLCAWAYTNTFRSEERRVGQECVSTCRSRCAPALKKK